MNIKIIKTLKLSNSFVGGYFSSKPKIKIDVQKKFIVFIKYFCNLVNGSKKEFNFITQEKENQQMANNNNSNVKVLQYYHLVGREKLKLKGIFCL